ncbi:fibronectin type III-like domain-contianing protein [Streptomyces sp. NK08204]|uniref:glycoside hydrolase family 3 protein n=1 Tax=Streptomyces sp. NK08204 TaxID=2873260 RepID=UPI0035A919F9
MCRACSSSACSRSPRNRPPPSLADVLLGREEPGGRLPTTWPDRLADAPVTRVTPEDGVLPYEEGLFIGYPAWRNRTVAPAYPFGHGLGYTTWEYLTLDAGPDSVHIRLRNSGTRPGRETVQIYAEPLDAADTRPSRRLAGFTTVTAPPGGTAEAVIPLSARTFQIWDEAHGAWTTAPGRYRLHASRSSIHEDLSVLLTVPAGL